MSKSSFALRKHNANIHEKKVNRNKLFNTKSTKVIPDKDGKYELSSNAQNELITQLKQEIVALEAENKNYRSTLKKYKEQINSLRLISKQKSASK